MNGFTHLHCHTRFSLLDGHCRIKSMVEKAKALGQTAIAITDHGYMYGVVEFNNACKDAGIKPIFGCEFYTAPTTIYEKNRNTRSSGHLVVLAKNAVGYKNLTKLASIAATDGMYYKPHVDLDLLRKHHDGLICLSACLQGDIPRMLLEGKTEEAYKLAAEYKDIFGEDYYIELQNHGLEDQKKLLPMLIALAKELDIPMVATNDVHYVERKEAFAQRALMCMSMKTTVDDTEAVGYGNPDEWYLKSEQEMEAIFADIAPEALTNTKVIADKCNVELEMGKYHLPAFPLPEGFADNNTFFEELCRAGLKKRYRKEADKHLAALEHEIQVIKKMGFVDYFLIVFDIISFAKTNGIPVGPGRGSAAGSIVAYCLGITDLDPTKYGLLFERFLNPERVTMPDVDIDVDPEGRDMIIDHIVETYGANHVAQIITYSALAAKSAINDVGKALNMAPEKVKSVSKLIPTGVDVTIQGTLEANKTLAKLYEEDAEARKLLTVAMSCEGAFRHTSTHAAGIIISPQPLSDLIPVTHGQEGSTILVSQLDMGSVEQMGMLKVDLLGLKTLTVLKHAENAIREKQGPDEIPINLSALKMQDQSVYAMMAKGYTGGVFQFESQGMRDVLRKMKPSCFEDLIAAIALYRPGPMESIPAFVENKHNPEQMQYLHPALEPILKETYSTIVYQEQVMSIVRNLAGYSYGRADLVRRAMAKKKADKMAQEKDYFINGKLREDGSVEVEGALRRGIPADVAEKLWEQMASFASYAFNKSHAACYAALAYRTAFLRKHYPLEFMAALLTNALGDSKKLVKLLNECEKQGIEILPPDINKSSAHFTVEGNGVRFGLMAIKETGKAVLAELDIERRQGPFTDLHDLVERTIASANKKTLEALIKSGALDSFPHNRAEMLAVLPAMLSAASKARKKYSEQQIGIEDMFFAPAEDPDKFRFGEVEYPKDITPLTLRQKLEMEMDACGMYISGHPMNDYADIVEKKTTHKLCDFGSDSEDEETAPAQQMQDGVQVRVAGIIRTKRELLTKNKQSMAFISIEDQTGKADVTVFPKAYEAYRDKLVEGTAILVFGKVEASEYGTKIIADSVAFLDAPAEPATKTK